VRALFAITRGYKMKWVGENTQHSNFLFAHTHLVESFLEHWTGKATPWIRSRVLRDPRTIFTKQLIILSSSEATVTKLKLKISASLSPYSVTDEAEQQNSRDEWVKKPNIWFGKPVTTIFE
jgi:hypothetical protein